MSKLSKYLAIVLLCATLTGCTISNIDGRAVVEVQPAEKSDAQGISDVFHGCVIGLYVRTAETYGRDGAKAYRNQIHTYCANLMIVLEKHRQQGGGDVETLIPSYDF